MTETCFLCGGESALHRIKLAEGRKLSNGMYQPARYADVCDRHRAQPELLRPERRRRKIKQCKEQGVLFR